MRDERKSGLAFACKRAGRVLAMRVGRAHFAERTFVYVLAYVARDVEFVARWTHTFVALRCVDTCRHGRTRVTADGAFVNIFSLKEETVSCLISHR